MAAPLSLPALSRAQVALLALVLLGSAALRLHAIGDASLGVDELLTLQFSSGHGYAHERLESGAWIEAPLNLVALETARPTASIWTSLGDDTHPPLHLLLLRLWREAAGDSDAAARGLSALLSTLAVLLLFDAARHWHGAATGLWTAAVMGVAHLQIEHAQEARSYMLLTALACALLSLAARIDTRGATARRLALLGGCALAMMLTHYLAAATLAPVGALLLRPRARRRGVLLALAAAAVVYAAAWMPQWLVQRGNAQHIGWLADEAPGHAARTAARLAALPGRMLFEPQAEVAAVLRVGAVALVLPLLMLRRDPRLAWWLAAAWGPLAAVAAADLARRTAMLEFPRYVIAASPAVYALFAALLATARAAWMRPLLPAVAILGCALAGGNAWVRWKPDFRGLARALAAAAPDATPVVILRDGADDWPAGVRWLAVCRYAGIRAPLVVLDAPPRGALLDRLRSAGEARVVANLGQADAIGRAAGGRVDGPVLTYPGAGSVARVVYE